MTAGCNSPGVVEHEAVQVAITSLDFEPTPAERTRMETGIAACPECAAIAVGHLEIARMLERLPVHEASPLVRQRVMRAAHATSRTPVAGAPGAAALFGLLLAATAAAGAFRADPLDPIVQLPGSGEVTAGVADPVSYWCRTTAVIDGLVPMPAVLPTTVPAP